MEKWPDFRFGSKMSTDKNASRISALDPVPTLVEAQAAIIKTAGNRRSSRRSASGYANVSQAFMSTSRVLLSNRPRTKLLNGRISQGADDMACTRRIR